VVDIHRIEPRRAARFFTKRYINYGRNHEIKCEYGRDERTDAIDFNLNQILGFKLIFLYKSEKT